MVCGGGNIFLTVFGMMRAIICYIKTFSSSFASMITMIEQDALGI